MLLKVNQFVTIVKEVEVEDAVWSKHQALRLQAVELETRINANTGKEVSLYHELEEVNQMIDNLGVYGIVEKQLDKDIKGWEFA